MMAKLNQVLKKIKIWKLHVFHKISFSMMGIYHFSPKLCIFSTKNLTKFQLLGGYMVATPTYHLAPV